MGHYWAEMDPEGAAAHDRHMIRLNALRDRLRKMSLGDFTSAELVPLMRVMGYSLHDEPNSEDIAILEKKLNMKAPQPKRKRR